MLSEIIKTKKDKLISDIVSKFLIPRGMTITEELLSIWIDSLSHLKEQQIESGYDRAKIEYKGEFLIQPQKFIEFCMNEKPLELEAQMAWMLLLDTIRRKGTHQTIYWQDGAIAQWIKGFGGWSRIGKLTDKEIPFVRKQFIEEYKSFREYDISHTHLVPGIGFNQSKSWSDIYFIGQFTDDQKNEIIHQEETKLLNTQKTLSKLLTSIK